MSSVQAGMGNLRHRIPRFREQTDRHERDRQRERGQLVKDTQVEAPKKHHEGSDNIVVRGGLFGCRSLSSSGIRWSTAESSSLSLCTSHQPRSIFFSFLFFFFFFSSNTHTHTHTLINSLSLPSPSITRWALPRPPSHSLSYSPLPPRKLFSPFPAFF